MLHISREPLETKAKVESFYTRASFDAASFNEESRTVDVVFATETTDVRRYDWNNSTYFIEQLVCDPSSVRLDRLNSGAPLLDNHDSYSSVAKSVLGKVEPGSAKLAGKEGRATVRFSARADVQPIMQDVKDGILTNISVGYRVHTYERDVIVDGETPTYRAIDWEPFEISLVPIPADYKAGVRSANEDHASEITIKQKENTTQNTRTMSEEKESATVTTTAATTVNENEVRAAELKRADDILDSVAAAKLPVEFARTLIKEKKSVEEARGLIIAEMVKSEANTRSQASSEVKTDEADKRAAGMEAAILMRANPSLLSADEKKGGNEFRGMSLIRMAEECASRAGANVRGMSERQIAEIALGTRAGANSTSDFPIILGNTVNRTLRKAYELAPRTFMPFTNQSTAKDFRTITRAQLGDVSALAEVKEGEEYTYGTMGEAKESYVVKKYGKIIPITWETLINDDLNAFSRLPQSIAQKAAQLQSDIVWGIITANAALADGVALFHGTHKNLGTTAAISVTSLTEARKLMRKQMSIAGDYMNLTPSFLIVAPELEGLANQYTSSQFVANQSSSINPAFNTSLKVIVEPRLSATNSGLTWYLSADPSQIDTIEYAFLEGEGELFTEQRVGFGTDGLEIKARMVFGAKAIDYRGLAKNVGA